MPAVRRSTATDAMLWRRTATRGSCCGSRHRTHPDASLRMSPAVGGRINVTHGRRRLRPGDPAADFNLAGANREDQIALDPTGADRPVPRSIPRALLPVLPPPDGPAQSNRRVVEPKWRPDARCRGHPGGTGAPVLPLPP